MTRALPPIALFYQALPPPLIDGLRKEAKPGGYSDGGADIGFALKCRDVNVVTPVADPDPSRALDWVFPDTPEGLKAAKAAGAKVFWANTVLFNHHPIGAYLGKIEIIGQLPRLMQDGDEKQATNLKLAAAGLPVARSVRIGLVQDRDVGDLAHLDHWLERAGMQAPVIVKPVRGRGSQGVSLARTYRDAMTQALALISSARFGDQIMVEEFLPGQEVTVTVMPPSSIRPDGTTADDHWALRPVERFDQVDEVAPYNGDVPVTANSRAMATARLDDLQVQTLMAACTKAARVVGSRGIIRIDARQDAFGRYRLFDLNMKPNLTGPGRPGREAQASLSAIAAEAEGWDYADLVLSLAHARF